MPLQRREFHGGASRRPSTTDALKPRAD